MLQRGHREVAFRPVDHRIRDHTARDRLQRVLAAFLELEFRRHPGGELDQFMVQEGHPYFQAPGHRHVVHALDGIIDDQGGGVEAPDFVEEGIGLRLGQFVRHQLGGDVRYMPRWRNHLQVLGMVAVEVVAAEAFDRRAGFCGHQRIPEITAEHLIGALPRQHNLHLFRHPLAEQVERNHVVAHRRLGHGRHGFGQARQHLAVGDQVLVVTGFELRCDQVGELELVGLFSADTDAGHAFKADREGQQVVHVIGKQTHQQARIQTTRQQHAHRHVGGQAVAVQRAHQHLARVIQPLGLGQGLRRPRGVQVPVHLLCHWPVHAHRHRAGR